MTALIDEEHRLKAEQALIVTRLKAIRVLLQGEKRSRRGSRGRHGWSKQVVDGAIEYLTQKRGRATSIEIWQALESRGIAAPNVKTPPHVLVSAVLSSCSNFDNSRQDGGYGLVFTESVG